jgi:hypothetical protein
MLASFTVEFDPALPAIYVLSSGDLYYFAIDKGIYHLFSGLLQVVPERFPGNSHQVSSLVLLDLEEIAKTDSFELFYG